jgi:hypothetical protein
MRCASSGVGSGTQMKPGASIEPSHLQDTTVLVLRGNQADRVPESAVECGRGLKGLGCSRDE